MVKLWINKFTTSFRGTFSIQYRTINKMNDKAIFTFIKKYIFFVSAYSYPINKPTRMLPAHNNTHVSDMHTGSRGRVRSRVMPREKEQKRKKKKEKERERRSFAIIRRYIRNMMLTWANIDKWLALYACTWEYQGGETNPGNTRTLYETMNYYYSWRRWFWYSIALWNIDVSMYEWSKRQK